jgi:hypothetical protein
MCSTRILTRRDVLKGATAVGAVARLPGASVSFAGRQDEQTRDIATMRQLFLDNWIVERTSGLERTLHQPEKKGLIQEADGRPWERGYVSWFGYRTTSGRTAMTGRSIRAGRSAWATSCGCTTMRLAGIIWAGRRITPLTIKTGDRFLSLLLRQGPLGLRTSP